MMAVLRDFYDLGQWRVDMVDELWCRLCSTLPKEPVSDSVYWADGTDTILSVDHDAIEYLADAFDAMYGIGMMVTGYYDPEEDARNRETDRYTGYYYCNNI